MPRFFLLPLFYRWHYVCPFHSGFGEKLLWHWRPASFKKTRLFLVYMPLEPQSGKCSWSTSNIYHQHKNLYKMQMWHSRRLKSSIFLYLKGFKSMSPINVAVTMRLPLGRMEQGGTGIMKPCIPAYKTICIFYSNQSLLNTEAESQGFITPLCFLFSSLAFFSPASCALHSATGQFRQEWRVTAPLCWWQHWTGGLFHLLSKYSTNIRQDYLQKILPNYS